jgi:hypothetical protein
LKVNRFYLSPIVFDFAIATAARGAAGRVSAANSGFCTALTWRLFRVQGSSSR